MNCILNLFWSEVCQRSRRQQNSWVNSKAIWLFWLEFLKKYWSRMKDKDFNERFVYTDFFKDWLSIVHSSLVDYLANVIYAKTVPLPFIAYSNWHGFLRSPRKISMCVSLAPRIHFFHKGERKGYLTNLLETALLPQFFVFWVRDFKLWLLAYFLISFNCAKFQQDWTTLILHIL